jgi:hypothetical protein
MGKYGEITEHIKNMPYNEWNKITGFENREDIKRFYCTGYICFRLEHLNSFNIK